EAQGADDAGVEAADVGLEEAVGEVLGGELPAVGGAVVGRQGRGDAQEGSEGKAARHGFVPGDGWSAARYPAVPGTACQPQRTSLVKRRCGPLLWHGLLTVPLRPTAGLLFFSHRLPRRWPSEARRSALPPPTDHRRPTRITRIRRRAAE